MTDLEKAIDWADKMLNSASVIKEYAPHLTALAEAAMRCDKLQGIVNEQARRINDMVKK
jgi:hypothetical protein